MLVRKPVCREYPLARGRLEIHEADAETRGSREIGWLFEVEWVRLVCGPKYLMRLQRVVLTFITHDWHQCDNYGLDDWAGNCPEHKVTAVEVTQPVIDPLGKSDLPSVTRNK